MKCFMTNRLVSSFFLQFLKLFNGVVHMQGIYKTLELNLSDTNLFILLHVMIYMITPNNLIAFFLPLLFRLSNASLAVMIQTSIIGSIDYSVLLPYAMSPFYGFNHQTVRKYISVCLDFINLLIHPVPISVVFLDLFLFQTHFFDHSFFMIRLF